LIAHCVFVDVDDPADEAEEDVAITPALEIVGFTSEVPMFKKLLLRRFSDEVNSGLFVPLFEQLYL